LLFDFDVLKVDEIVRFAALLVVPKEVAEAPGRQIFNKIRHGMTVESRMVDTSRPQIHLLPFIKIPLPTAMFAFFALFGLVILVGSVLAVDPIFSRFTIIRPDDRLIDVFILPSDQGGVDVAERQGALDDFLLLFGVTRSVKIFEQLRAISPEANLDIIVRRDSTRQWMLLLIGGGFSLLGITGIMLSVRKWVRIRRLVSVARRLGLS
jgi:hypothetical protein